MRRVNLSSATLATAVAFGGMAGCAPPQMQVPGTHRNLVLVVIDTLRRDHLPCYGYPRPTAPTLSRLAEEGAMADGISPTSWTKPAVASILTGLHPLRHRAIGGEDVLPAAAETLAERLKAHGYSSLGVTANGFVGARYGFGQGFDEYVTLPEQGFGRFEPAATVNRVVFEKMARLRPPFFLYVHYLDPHAPYEPMSARRSWRLTGRLLPRRTPVTIFETEEENFMTRPPELMRDAVDQYDGEILGVDDAIAELLDRLRHRGPWTSPVVVVTSDHGEEMQEHGRMGHGKTLYEEVVKVPLILWAPGSIPPRSRHGTLSLMDVAPTVLDILGISTAEGMDGLDLAQKLRDGWRIDGSERELLLHLDAPGGQYLALRTDAWKLVLGRGPYRKEIFNLETDSGERINLLESAAGRRTFASLARRLVERHDQTARGALAAEKGKDDAETREAMAALGYVGSGGTQGIPLAIRPPDGEPGGLLGWEDTARFRDCLDPTKPAAEDQLLSGWYAAKEKDGRWTWPEATVAFRLPPGRGDVRIRVAGRSPGAARSQMRLNLGDETVLETWVEPGPFEVVVRTAKGARPGVNLLRMGRRPEGWLPPRIGQKGRQRVGFFVRAVCVQPAAADRPAHPAGGG